MDYNIDKEDLMNRIKELLAPELTTISFNTYIKDLIIEDISGSHIIFQCDGPLIKDYLENKYAPLILNTIQYLTNRAYTFSVHNVGISFNDEKNSINSHRSGFSCSPACTGPGGFFSCCPWRFCRP